MIFRGSLNNKIHRWKSCFDEFNIKYAATIDADDPSFSFSLVRKALEQLKKSDADMFLGKYDGNKYEPGNNKNTKNPLI